MNRPSNPIYTRLRLSTAALLLPLLAGFILTLTPASQVRASVETGIAPDAKLIQVRLVNASDGKPIAGQPIRAREQLPGGKWQKRGRKTTDRQGKVAFRYERVRRKAGTVELRARPYNSLVNLMLMEPGEYKLAAGRLALLVVGHDQQPLGNWHVTLREQSADGKVRRRARGRTDDDGWVHFDIVPEPAGRPFLQALSPTDLKTRKRIELPAWTGKHKVVIGNPPVNLMVVNGITEDAVADLRVQAKEIMPDGSLRPAGAQMTNAQGLAMFDLDFGAVNTGLGSRRYLFKTKPYNAGAVISAEVREPGDFTFRVGTSPVTLIDKSNGNPMSGVSLIAYWQNSQKRSTKRRRCCRGSTDQSGRVHFDYRGVSKENPIVVIARNPFGNGKHFASNPIFAPGEFKFMVGGTVDRIPPDVVIVEPAAGTLVPAKGFDVVVKAIDPQGTAADQYGVTEVSIHLTRQQASRSVRPSLGNDNTVAAIYDPATGRWLAEYTSLESGRYTAIAIAEDKAGNEGKNRPHTIMVVAEDTLPPRIEIQSHANDDPVSENGFTLSGVATDDASGVQRVTAELLTQGATTPVSLSVVLDAQTGSWRTTVNGENLNVGTPVTITVTATDEFGNSAAVAVMLNVIVVHNDALLRHLMDRITYGPTVALRQEVQGMGSDAFIAQQLEQQTDADFQQRLLVFEVFINDYLPDPNADYATQRSQLQRYALQHAWRDPRQLRAVLAQFWDNHFSTDMDSHGVVEYELREHQAFRSNAFGNFRDLLEVSAKSPAMSIYLDGNSNCANDSNENYARELLELHTLSDNGSYQQDDVEALAEVFTGWTVENGQFKYNADCHNPADKVLTLGADANPVTYTITGRTGPEGVNEGMEVLNILARQDSTAVFVCTKLAQRFVSDTPGSALVSACKQKFLQVVDDPDQIGQVVQAILESAQFNTPENFRAKVSTPLEYVARTLRAFEAAGNGADLPTRLNYLGMPLFQNSAPDGFAETGENWLSGTLLLERFNFVTWLTHNLAGADRSSVDPLAFATAYGLRSAEEIVNFFLALALGSDYTDLERVLLLEILNANGAFDINQTTADEKLRMMLATLLSFSKYQLQ